MGRGKIEIRRIENTNNRHVTYSKRRNGMMKNVKVSLIIFASSGKMHEYCSPSPNLAEMLGNYQQLSGNRLWDEKHESLNSEIDRDKKENDNMQIELRHLKGEDIQSLNYKIYLRLKVILKLASFAFIIGSHDAYTRMMECLRELKRKEKMIEEENKQLSLQLVEEVATTMPENEVTKTMEEKADKDIVCAETEKVIKDEEPTVETEKVEIEPETAVEEKIQKAEAELVAAVEEEDASVSVAPVEEEKTAEKKSE